jgi:hypothetical protein
VVFPGLYLISPTYVDQVADFGRVLSEEPRQERRQDVVTKDNGKKAETFWKRIFQMPS